MKKLLSLILVLLASISGAQIVSSGGTFIAAGGAIGGCTAPAILSVNSAGNLVCTAASIVNGSVSTAGRSILTIKDTITGASATSNFLNVTGSFNSTLSAATRGAMLSFTGDNDSQIQEGLNVSFAGGGSNSATRSISSIMTGTHVNGPSYAVYGDNASIGGNGWSMGVAGISAVNTAAKYALGVLGLGSTINQVGTYATGGWFTGGGSAATTNIIGVAGGAYSGGTNGIGGLFYLSSTAGMDPVNNYVGSYTTITGKAALVADNGSVAANIFEARDNGTAVFTIADGGAVTMGTAILTTQMTMSNNALMQFGPNSAWSTMYSNTALTPDAAELLMGTAANAIPIAEYADNGYDFQNGACGTAACTDPGLIIHSAAQDTTQYNHNAVWGTAGGAVKTLTESSATALVRIPVANNSRASGELHYEIYATDGTDMQVRTSRIRYAMTNKAGTEACTLVASDGAAANAETNDDNASQITAGTLTYGIACTNNAADTMDITFNAVSSLVQTTLQATWSVVHKSPGQPARQ